MTGHCQDGLCRVFGVALALILLVPPLASAQAQTNLKTCPARTLLKLDDVLGLISKKLPDERIAGLILVCHVSFTLEPAALERLSGVGASAPILEALDRETVSRLSLVQAREEVMALENRKRANGASTTTDRDSVLYKFDAAYKTQREKAALVEPKGQFETTAEYNARVMKANRDALTMDQDHDAERSRLMDKFSTDLARRNEILDHRIAFLKQSLYPSGDAQPKYISYDPDITRLAAQIRGQEFWFRVEPSRAKLMYEHWSSVKVLQRYEDEVDARFLLESSIDAPIAGRSRSRIEDDEKKEKIQALLDAAQKSYGAGTYDQAREQYANVLTLDPNNELAKEGVATSQQAIGEAKQRQANVENQTRELAELRRNLAQNPKLIAGTWYDAATNLLWTDKDNGKDVTWEEAKSYCESLGLDGFSDWRLATYNELSSLYDATRTKYTKVPPKSVLNATLNPFSTAPAPQSVPYHMKGDITLSRPFSWTSSMNRGQPQAGSFADRNVAVKGDGRTLCTRRLEISVGQVATPGAAIQSANSKKAEAPRVGQYVCPGVVLGDVDRLIGDKPQAPDLVVKVPTKIVEVDPQGVGVFRVAGSPGAYYLKSGGAPKASCSTEH